MNAVQSLQHFIPELILIAGAFILLSCDFISKLKGKLGVIASLFLLAALFSIKTSTHPLPLFFGCFHVDPLTFFFRLFILGTLLLIFLSSLKDKRLQSSFTAEYYALILFMGLGMICIAASKNLLMLYLSIEFISIVSYLLVGFIKNSTESKEASVKYLLFGSVASGLMLFGISYLYGVSGSIDFSVITFALSQPEHQTIGTLALVLVMCGIGFKISMVPLHMWAPDVYHGAPTQITALLAVGSKAAGFAALLRISSMFMPVIGEWVFLIHVFAILTMTLGNITAIAQTNLKRFLAYSSIAHAGYILMGVAALGSTAQPAVIIYLITYLFANVGAFAWLIGLEIAGDARNLDDVSGLSQRHPFSALAATIFLLSLTGLPPLAGFIGKYFVFAEALKNGLYFLAIVGALNSAVAAYYYFKIIRIMYLKDPQNGAKEISLPRPIIITLIICVLGTLLPGLFPELILQFF